MIAKQVPMKSIGRSSFGGLVDYITNSQHKQERVGVVTVTNCVTHDPELAVIEVLNTQQQNLRAKSDKTYHLILSFQAGESPSPAALADIERHVCAGLGFDEHQRVSAVHHDTDNLHVHVAVNKIHPRRHTLHDPFNDYHTLGLLCEEMELRHGLGHDNHEPRRSVSEGRAADMERHAGIGSLERWVRETCAERMKAATSWAEIHATLAEHGLELHRGERGLAVVDRQGLGVKASAVARELSAPKLEKRLGAFEPATVALARSMPGAIGAGRRPAVPPVGRPPPMPLRQPLSRVATLGALRSLSLAGAPRSGYALSPLHRAPEAATLFARYQAEQDGVLPARQVALQAARELQRRERRQLDQTGPDGPLSSQQRIEDRRRIDERYRAAAKAVRRRHPRLAWADWLRAQASAGDAGALALLREAAKGLQGNVVSGALQ